MRRQVAARNTKGLMSDSMGEYAAQHHEKWPGTTLL